MRGGFMDRLKSILSPIPGLPLLRFPLRKTVFGILRIGMRSTAKKMGNTMEASLADCSPMVYRKKTFRF